MPIFPILLGLFLMASLAIFLAQTFTFLATQIFYEISVVSGVWVASLEITAGIILFLCVILRMMKRGVCSIAEKKIDTVKSIAAHFGITGKVLVSFIIYEVIKLYIKKIKK